MILSHSIETDSYDRTALDRIKADTPSLCEIEAVGAKLLPHFDGLLLDLFALLFKLNVVICDTQELRPSAMFCRRLLDHVRSTPAVETIRGQSVLDEHIAGLATVLLAERLLGLLRSERILSRGEMLDFWNFERQEADLSGQDEEIETARLIEAQIAGKPAARQIAEIHKRIDRQRRTAARALRRQAEQTQARLAERASERQNEIDAEAAQMLRDLDVAAREAEQWGAEIGGSGASSPGRKIELGHRLAKNPKLRQLARLVGRMRESARALRRTLYEKSNEEIYEIGAGADLSHLLPAELIGMHHPLLRRDFVRRLIESQLMVYALRAQEQKGRGPMVVCLDGSSSMAGEKEIWAKAVTLTLLDLARRQRRRFRSICFSSAQTPLQIFEESGANRWIADMDLVFRIAEYFPGGGTDFQQPLAAAIECMQQDAKLRRGDIVLITDGECSIDPQWLGELKRAKTRLGFSLFSVLIDIGPSSLGALAELSDKVTSVTQLTTEGSRDIFLRL